MTGAASTSAPIEEPVLPAAAPQAVAAKAAPAAPTATAYHCSLEEFILRRFAATFDDDAIKPAGHLEFDLDELTSRNLTGRPLSADTPITIAGFGRAPGIAHSVTLKGQTKQDGNKQDLAVHLAVEGIKLDALAPYLAASGLRSQYNDGQLTADINGTFSTAGGALTGDAAVKTIRLADGERELLNIPSIRLVGLH